MPVKVKKDGDKWCVTEPDGSVVKCHSTEEKAKAQAAAINANTEKEDSRAEKHSSYYLPYNATSFDDVDAVKLASEKSEAISELTRNYTMLVDNIVYSDEDENKLGLIRNVSDQFIDRLEALSKNNSSEEKGASLISKFINVVGGALGIREKSGAEVGGESDWFVYKDSGGTYRWVATYSNMYRDSDNPPEIISSDSHRNFARMVKEGVVPLPKLWLWHTKEWEFGQSEWVKYDEDGFAVAGGYIYDDPVCIAVAKSISKMGDVLVSHGMPRRSITRNESDPTIIQTHITQEVSPLPGWAAANKLTGFEVLGDDKENKNMAFSKDDRKELLEQYGVSGDILDALEERNAKAKQLADKAGLESKEADAAAVSEEADAPPATDAQPAESQDEPKQPAETPEIDVQGQIDGELKEVLQGTLELVSHLGQEVKELKEAITKLSEEEEDRIAEKAQMTSLASMLDITRASVIGKESARVDGRTALAKDKPVEVEAKRPSATGIPLIDQWVN